VALTVAWLMLVGDSASGEYALILDQKMQRASEKSYLSEMRRKTIEQACDPE
jgi:hypothetical protein